MTEPNLHPSDDSADKSPDQGGDDAHSQPIMLSTPDDPASNDDWYLWAGVLILIVLGSFLPAVTGQFITAVDRQLASGISSGGQDLGYGTIWTDVHAGPQSDPQYEPVTLTFYRILHDIWSRGTPNPLGFRATSLLLHAIGVVLLWRMLRRLSVPGAFIIAAVWAIHPVQAETLCSVSQLKSILALLFGLWSMWYFFDYAEVRPSADDTRQPAKTFDDPQNALIASIVLFVLAVLSQAAVAVLPLAMIPILIWKNRLKPNVVLALVPLLVVGIGAGWLAVTLEHARGGIVAGSPDDFSRPLLVRLLIASRCVWFYLGKILAPVGLSAMYSRWPSNDPHLWVFFAAALAVPAALLALHRRMGWGPFAAVAWFGIMLIPHVGLFDITSLRYSDVADHFQYLPSIGPIALIVSGIAIAFQRYQAAHLPSDAAPTEVDAADAGGPPAMSKSTRLAVLATLAFLFLLAAGTWLRCDKFATPIALWNDALSGANADNPALWPAHRYLALALTSEADTETSAGDTDEAHATLLDAAAQFKIVLDAHPRALETEILTDLGSTYLKLGRPQQADDYLEQAADRIAADPDAADNPASFSTYLNLGIVRDQLAAQKPNPDFGPAITALEHASSLLFSNNLAATAGVVQERVNACTHLAAAYFHAKRYPEAVRDQLVAVAEDPSNFESSYLLAEYQAWNGQLKDARRTQATMMRDYYTAFQSANPPSYNDFMGVLEMNQDPPNAKLAQSLFSDALKADPGNTTIAGHLAAVNAFLQWAATTQPTTQSTVPPTTNPTTKPVLPPDFTIFLTRPATGPSTAPTTAPDH
jgi:tetratricopeptide (TPR) repeat protein